MVKEFKIGQIYMAKVTLDNNANITIFKVVDFVPGKEIINYRDLSSNIKKYPDLLTIEILYSNTFAPFTTSPTLVLNDSIKDLLSISNKLGSL